MKIIPLILTLFLILPIVFCGGSTPSSVITQRFILKITVNLDGEPIEGVAIQIDFDGSSNPASEFFFTFSEITDSNGKCSIQYKFKKINAKYRISIQNPVTGDWTEPREGIGKNGTTKSETFQFTS